ncbi:ABC transporter ATP-binding protein [uncultured Marivita sp.]|uniref:ABC transporter ATP-binding protein n=1 Tax=uncultured Marivita sp. TaxID=888080 RepID=UPI002638398B|nr:ABC transporter ATP-binding protein [uncultured Marivita sp.]
MSSVTLEQTSKKFGDFTAVREMDLAIRNGEFVAILGPSGCGKTTTMNMIAGLEDVTSGTIRFDDRDVTEVSTQKRGVGFVFQSYAIFTHMTVRQNLAFGLEVQGVEQAEIDRRVGDMAEFMALGHRIDVPSAGLSVNEMQKLAIGRSAIVEPSIFLLDEPLSNLDAAFREKMRAELRGLQRALKQTMVYVTHDQIEAMGLADRIAVMNHAVLQQFDTPVNIYARPANVFVARFMGAPGMNIVNSRVTEGGVLFGGRDADFVALSREDMATLRHHGERDLLLGFRPEELRLGEVGAPGSIAADVALVETVGRRKIVHLVSGTTAFHGVCDRGVPVRAGEAVGVTISPDKVHLFDTETEARLQWPVEATHG